MKKKVAGVTKRKKQEMRIEKKKWKIAIKKERPVTVTHMHKKWTTYLI